MKHDHVIATRRSRAMLASCCLVASLNDQFFLGQLRDAHLGVYVSIGILDDFLGFPIMGVPGLWDVSDCSGEAKI